MDEILKKYGLKYNLISGRETFEKFIEEERSEYVKILNGDDSKFIENTFDEIFSELGYLCVEDATLFSEKFIFFINGCILPKWYVSFVSLYSRLEDSSENRYELLLNIQHSIRGEKIAKSSNKENDPFHRYYNRYQLEKIFAPEQAMNKLEISVKTETTKFLVAQRKSKIIKKLSKELKQSIREMLQEKNKI